MDVSRIVRWRLPHTRLHVVVEVGERLCDGLEVEPASEYLEVPRRGQLDAVKVRQDGWRPVAVSNAEGGSAAAASV